MRLQLQMWKSCQMMMLMMGGSSFTHIGAAGPRTVATRTNSSLGAPPTTTAEKHRKVGKRTRGVSGIATQAIPGSEGLCKNSCKAMFFFYSRSCAMDGHGHFKTFRVMVMDVIEINSNT